MPARRVVRRRPVPAQLTCDLTGEPIGGVRQPVPYAAGGLVGHGLRRRVGRCDDAEAVVVGLADPVAVVGVPLHDGRVGDDVVRDRVGADREPHLHGEGPPGPDGESGEPVAVEDTDGLVGVGGLERHRVGAGAVAVVELQTRLGRRQGAALVDEDEDGVDARAGAGGGVGEVEAPGAVLAAGFVDSGAAVDAGGDGEGPVAGGRGAGGGPDLGVRRDGQRAGYGEEGDGGGGGDARAGTQSHEHMTMPGRWGWRAAPLRWGRGYAPNGLADAPDRRRRTQVQARRGRFTFRRRCGREGRR